MDDTEARQGAPSLDSSHMEHARAQSAASARAAGQMRAAAAHMRRVSAEQFADTVAQRVRMRRMRADAAAKQKDRRTGFFSVPQPREEP
jgi:hypothetical protein